MKNLKSQVFQWANKNFKMFSSRSEAFRYAYKLNKLTSNLANDIVEFKFKKNDGSLRVAKGTRNNNLFNYEYKGAQIDNGKQVSFFDVEIQKWRSFSILNLV